MTENLFILQVKLKLSKVKVSHEVIETPNIVSILVLCSMKNPSKHLQTVQTLLLKMKALLSANMSKASLSDVLMPVYVACRTVEKHKIADTETDIDGILREILKKSSNHSESSFNDLYVYSKCCSYYYDSLVFLSDIHYEILYDDINSSPFQNHKQF